MSEGAQRRPRDLIEGRLPGWIGTEAARDDRQQIEGGRRLAGQRNQWISIPTAGKSIKVPRQMHRHREWRDTHMHQVNYLFRQEHEHKYAYDRETLALILEQAGFVQVNRCEFDPALDCESRSIGTPYMNAREPERFQAA
jgi:hypothetical protein